MNAYALYFLTVVGFSGILYGLGGAAAMSVALPYIKATTEFTSQQLSLLVAGTMGAAVVSSMVAGVFCEWFGRKKTLLASALIFAAGGPLFFFSGGAYWMMYAGQLTFGTAMGLLGVAAPMYLAECLDAKSRGKGTAIFQLLLIVGIMISGVTGIVIAKAIGPADSVTLSLADKIFAWKTVFLSESVPGLLLFFLLLGLRESPRWLYKKGRRGEALASLAANNGEGKAKEILDEMVAADEKAAAEKAALAAKPKDSLLQRKYVVPFLIAFIILVCNQTTGINGVLGYSVLIFQQSGLKGDFANWADLVFKITMLVMTALACVVVDLKGRKFLLKVGTLGIIAGMLGAGVIFLGVERSRVDVTDYVKAQVKGGESLEVTVADVVANAAEKDRFLAEGQVRGDTQFILTYRQGGAGNQAVAEQDEKEGRLAVTPRPDAEKNGLEIVRAELGTRPSLATGWTVTVFLMIFIAAFAIGPGVCVWLALTELMPNRIRAVGMSVALFANQMVAMGLQATMLPLRDTFGYGCLFLTFAAATVVYFVTAAFFMPETKGRTLEEIEAWFAERGGKNGK